MLGCLPELSLKDPSIVRGVLREYNDLDLLVPSKDPTSDNDLDHLLAFQDPTSNNDLGLLIRPKALAFNNSPKVSVVCGALLNLSDLDNLVATQDTTLNNSPSSYVVRRVFHDLNDLTSIIPSKFAPPTTHPAHTMAAKAAYRHLLRATRVAFEGDYTLLHAARTQARTGFDSLSSLDPSSEEAQKQIQHAEGVATILRHNLVQGQQVEGSDAISTMKFC